MKQALLLIMVLLATITLSAQETQSNPEKDEHSVFAAWPNALGFMAGTGTGAGLSWQRWYGLHGIQVQAGGMYNPNNYYDLYNYSIGLRYSRMLHSYAYNNWIAGAVYLSATLSHHGRSVFIYPAPKEDPAELTVPAEIPVEETVYEPPKGTVGPYTWALMASAGVGSEFVLFEHLSFSLEYLYFVVLPDLTVEMAVSAGWHFRY